MWTSTRLDSQRETVPPAVVTSAATSSGPATVATTHPAVWVLDARSADNAANAQTRLASATATASDRTTRRPSQSSLPSDHHIAAALPSRIVVARVSVPA